MDKKRSVTTDPYVEFFRLSEDIAQDISKLSNDYLNFRQQC